MQAKYIRLLSFTKKPFGPFNLILVFLNIWLGFRRETFFQLQVCLLCKWFENLRHKMRYRIWLGFVRRRFYFCFYVFRRCLPLNGCVDYIRIERKRKKINAELALGTDSIKINIFTLLPMNHLSYPVVKTRHFDISLIWLLGLNIR